MITQEPAQPAPGGLNRTTILPAPPLPTDGPVESVWRSPEPEDWTATPPAQRKER
jgi:hypothetical protein